MLQFNIFLKLSPFSIFILLAVVEVILFNITCTVEFGFTVQTLMVYQTKTLNSPNIDGAFCS